MADIASRDQNRVTTLLGVDSSTFLIPTTVAVDPSTHEMLVKASVSITPSGTQDVNLTKVGGAAFALGQQLAASSLPVVLTAAQVSTLTPLSTVAVTQGTSPWVVSLASTTITGTVSVTQGTSPWIAAGGGTAGTAAAGVVTVQGIASMTPVQVSQATGTNLHTVVDSGSITANAGTNLNTSLLALESGGNLATLAGIVTASRAAVNLISGQVGVAGNTGVVGATTQRVTLATDVALPTGTNTLGSVNLLARSSDYYPMYNQMDFGGANLATDPSGALVVRGAVLTDEGAERANFTGTSLTISPGSATFTNGSYTVTGSGFTTSDMNFLDFIKLTADAESAWGQISFINSDTSITLFAPYTGTGGTGAFVFSPLGTLTGSGGTISVATGQLTVASGNTAATSTTVYSKNSSPPLIFETSATVSQRIVNQDIYIGVESAFSGTIRAFSRFHFTGTTNTQVITESGYNPTTTPSASETESNTITLPNAGVTSGAHVYKINMNINQVVFTIDGVIVATHNKKIPHKTVNVYYGNLRFLNGTTPASSTTIIADYVMMQSYDRLDVYQTLASVNAGVVDSQTTRVVQANGAGKTIVSAGGSAASNGNNTLVSAGTNRLKVKAFSLTTLSTTAMTCIFQSGAGGTELWRVVLQAPTGVSVGANLSTAAPDWLFATASATLLNLNLSSANAVHWSVSYYDEV